MTGYAISLGEVEALCRQMSIEVETLGEQAGELRRSEVGPSDFGSGQPVGELYATVVQGLLADSLHGAGTVSAGLTWQGDAASSARATFHGILSGTDGVRGQFARLRDALLVAVDTVDRAVFEKASGVAELYATTVGGVNAEEVTFLFDVSRRRATGVDGWLGTVFVPCYQERLARFDALCTAAERAVIAAWAGLESALREVHTDHFSGMITPTAPMTPPAAGASGVEHPQPGPQPEPLEAGQHAAVDTMLPAAALPVAAPLAVQLAPSTGGGAGTTFFGARSSAGRPPWAVVTGTISARYLSAPIRSVMPRPHRTPRPI